MPGCAHKNLEIIADLEAEVLFEAVPGQRVRAKRIDGKRLKLPRGIRYWFTARSVTGDCDVVLAKENAIKELIGCVAVTLPELGIIAVNEDTPLLRIVVALLHEFGHQIFSGPGEQEINAHVFGCSPKHIDRAEERLMGYQSTRWADLLLRSGLLRLPPIPRRRKRA